MLTRSLLAIVTIGLSIVSAAIAAGDNVIADVVIADFETETYGDWTITGEAFGSGPARADKLEVQGCRGRRMVDSFGPGDPATGTITSPPIELTRSHISFLIGGGRHDGETGIELLVDGKGVRRSTGADSGDLRWESWDVREFKGKQAQIRVFDSAKGAWGHTTVDHILLTDHPRSGSGAWRLEDYRRSADYFTEPYRPAYHFTPELNWVNDPNGLVFHKGEYHLFYQHNPHGNSWGHMSWGHAVSPDLVHWTHLPIALHDEYGTMAFSGSAVVDTANTSGFGVGSDPPLVAIYTAHGHGRQTQDLAFSRDNGRTWIKYDGNPVLDIGEAEFRDPKVFWHAPAKRWVMVVSLAVQKRLQFYGSPDLKKWTLLSTFGPAGVADKPNWECPDLFELPIQGEPDKTRWVLKADMGSKSVAGGSGGEYFTGTFDGETFTPDSTDSQWIDYGRDFYASASWSDIPAGDGRRIWIGWMNNWETANTPTWPWRGGMSVPRELTLRRIGDKLILCQTPVRELQGLRTAATEMSDQTLRDGVQPLPLAGQQLEIIAEFEPRSAAQFGIHVRKGAREQTTVGYDVRTQSIYVDRTKSGKVDYHPAFSGRHAAKLPLGDRRRIRLHVLVDTASVEVFANDGEVTITDLVFPEPESTAVELFSTGGDCRIVACQAWKLSNACRRPGN